MKPEYILFWDKEVVNKSFNIINFENCLDYKVSSNENAAVFMLQEILLMLVRIITPFQFTNLSQT